MKALEPQDGGAWSASRRLRIVVSLPELEPLRQVIRGSSTEATYIIQQYVYDGLRARGHDLTYVALQGLDDVVCTGEPTDPAMAKRSWSASRLFALAGKAAWRAQRVLGVPYLNVFSNLRLYDASLRCLPGHDVVYERQGMYRSGVGAACRRLGMPYVLYVEADDVLEHDYMGKPITGLLRWRIGQMMRHNLRAADRVICVSGPSRDHLVAAWRVPEAKIVVLPNGVDTEAFKPNPVARAEVRASMNLGDSPTIVFVGGFYVWHDTSTLLRSFGRVVASRPDARLLLVGDGEHRPAAARLAAELGLAGSARFVGAVPHAEVPRVLAAADIAVAPYPEMRQTMWFSPLKLFEYMASGLPIVATAVGQIAEVIRPGGNGLLVPPGDELALAAALESLVADRELRTRLGQQAREDAVRERSWDHYVARLEQVFEAAIESRRGGRRG